MEKIDITKSYKTRDGKPVELFDVNCHDCMGNASIVGCYLNSEGKRSACTWYEGGRFMLRNSDDGCELDLVAIPEEIASEPEQLLLTADEIVAAFNIAANTDAALGALGFKMAPAEILVDFWVNVYPNHFYGYSYGTKTHADNEADCTRIACINIKRTVVVGEGLDPAPISTGDY